MPPSSWPVLRALIEQRRESFEATIREKFKSDLKRRDMELTVYVDPDAIIVVVDEEVFINSDDEPSLFIGETHIIDASREIEQWQGQKKRSCA